MPHLSRTPLCCSEKSSNGWGVIGLPVASECQISIGAGWVMQQPRWTSNLFDTPWVEHLPTDLELLVRQSPIKGLPQEGGLRENIRKSWNPSMESIKVFFSQRTFTDSGSFALLQPKSTNFEYNPVPTLLKSGIVLMTSKIVEKSHMLPLALCQLKCLQKVTWTQVSRQDTMGFEYR